MLKSRQILKELVKKILKIDSDRFLIFLCNIFCFSFNDCIIEPFIVYSYYVGRLLKFY